MSNSKQRRRIDRIEKKQQSDLLDILKLLKDELIEKKLTTDEFVKTVTEIIEAVEAK